MQTAPLYDDIAHGPAGGGAHWVTAADGVRIRVAHWTGPDVKGTVLLFPGRTEYIEKYGDAVQRFLDAGYASVAVDWRGQGLADRLLPDRAAGHVGSFADYQTDLAAVLAHVDTLGLPANRYLVGHSLGGCIGFRALCEGLPVKAAALSAPMLGIIFAPHMRPVAWVVSWLARLAGFGDRIAPGQSPVSYVLREEFGANTLTRDHAMWDRLRTQLTRYPDLGLGGPTLQWLNLALREMRRLSHLPSPDVPTITFLGTNEAVVDPRRIHARMAKWPNGALVMLKGGEHEVMLEVPAIRDKVYAAMIAHFDAHL